MKNYRYDRENERFVVIEKSTEQKIKFVKTKEDAKEFARKLNGGHGFNGWTPAFFLLGVK